MPSTRAAKVSYRARYLKRKARAAARVQAAREARELHAHYLIARWEHVRRELGLPARELTYDSHTGWYTYNSRHMREADVAKLVDTWYAKVHEQELTHDLPEEE